MNYIKDSMEKPFTLHDFSFNDEFTLRSSENNYKICHFLLNNYHYNDNTLCTDIEITIWKSSIAYGRHIIQLVGVSSAINMKKLLIELANKFANEDFEEKYCYVEVEEENSSFKF